MWVIHSTTQRNDDDDMNPLGAWGDYDWISRVVLPFFQHPLELWCSLMLCYICSTLNSNVALWTKMGLWSMCTPPPLVRWESRCEIIRRQVRSARYVWNVSRWISTIISTIRRRISSGWLGLVVRCATGKAFNRMLTCTLPEKKEDDEGYQINCNIVFPIRFGCGPRWHTRHSSGL